MSNNGTTFLPSEMAEGIRKLKDYSYANILPASGVLFWDYDGAILHSFAPQEFLELRRMPSNPTHEGLTAQGWNWSLDDAKEYVEKYGCLDIGQMYLTDDEKTRIHVHVTEICMGLELRFGVEGHVTISFGDNSNDIVIARDDIRSRVGCMHTYAQPGDYVISCEVYGKMAFRGVLIGRQYADPAASVYPSDSFQVGSDTFGSLVEAQESVLKIEIGSNVSIDMQAFVACDGLQTITLPRGMESFGLEAFSDCRNIRGIIFPDGTRVIDEACLSVSSARFLSLPKSLERIGSGAFSGMNNLTRLTIPDNVAIENDVMTGCWHLSNVTLPEHVTFVEGDGLFHSCQALTSITLPKKMEKICGSMFQECTYLKQIILPPSLTSIEARAFQKCSSLETIICQGEVTRISDWAFEGCKKLKELYLPTDSLKTIGDRVFDHCESLEMIVFPESLEQIGNNYFFTCSSLEAVVFQSAVPPEASSPLSFSAKAFIPLGSRSAYMESGNYTYAWNASDFIEYSSLETDAKIEESEDGTVLYLDGDGAAIYDDNPRRTELEITSYNILTKDKTIHTKNRKLYSLSSIVRGDY